MLKIGGGGALDRQCMRKLLGPRHFSLKPHPFGIYNAVRPLWQEFLGCSNEETNKKSTRTDSVAKFYDIS